MDAGGDASSLLSWWQLAGVDTLVEDAPRDWLAAPKQAATVLPAARGRDAVPNDLPNDLVGMRALLAAIEIPGTAGPRALPEGDPASGLMLLADMPEAAGEEHGSLREGVLGRLLEAMLAAIGRDRSSIYHVELFPLRPLGGRPDAALVAEFGGIARHHAALAAPKAMLLMGDAASRAIIGTDVAQARGRIHHINHAGGTFAAIATFHPRLLLNSAARKADAWRDLRLLLGELDRCA